MSAILQEATGILAGWGALDTWIAITAALAAMACALPGVFLMLRRQSMIGDALSHTTLPGIILAFLAAQWIQSAGWISPDTYFGAMQGIVFVGALVVGVLTGVLTEWIHKLGRVEASAALGVVFTTLFAVGLVLVRAVADRVDLDPDCVLYGTIETTVIDTYGASGIPRAAVVNGAILLVNLVLTLVLLKELRLAAFDPALATTLGLDARRMHYGLMAVTAATLVIAFASVGSILVIAMLIVPAATATLLTQRLWKLIGLSVVLAGLSAPLGHVMAIVIPPIVFSRLGFPSVRDASTAGMMAVAAGLLFVLAMVFAPRAGLVSRAVGRVLLAVRIAGEDLLGLLHRAEEAGLAEDPRACARLLAAVYRFRPIVGRLAVYGIVHRRQVVRQGSLYRLTDTGREAARQLVRSHRLWEAYMAKHFDLADDHLHVAAERAEHYIDLTIREGLTSELDRPEIDPHGRVIPEEGKPAE